ALRPEPCRSHGARPAGTAWSACGKNLPRRPRGPGRRERARIPQRDCQNECAWKSWPSRMRRGAGLTLLSGTDEAETPCASRVTAILAEQVELLLHRAVGETEQNRIGVGFVGHPVPARHHEEVARAPFEGLLADPRATPAFDGGEHGGIRRAVALGAEPRLRQLDDGAGGCDRAVSS